MPSATGLMRLSLVVAAVFAAGIGALVAAVGADPGRNRAPRGHCGNPRRHRARADHPRRRHGLAVSDRDGELLRCDARRRARRDPALAADRLTAKLQLLPLLFGRIEPADVSLTRPRLVVKVEPDGRSNWSGLMATLARTLKPGAQQSGRVLSFSEIRMSGGTITVTDAARGVAEELSDVELSFAWPSISRSFGATGRFMLARRGVRRERQRGRSARRALGRPLRPEAAARRRAVQARLRRPHQPAPDAQDGRHARGRRQIAARGAALGQPAAAARRRASGRSP